MSTTSVEIADVSKKFRLYREKPSSLKARLISSRARADDFWALRGVSFDIEPGQSVVGSHDRLKQCDRSAALGHLQRLTTPNPAQVDAEVLPKLAYTDPIHDAQNVAQLRQAIRPGPRRDAVRGSKPRRSRSAVATPPATHEPLPRLGSPPAGIRF